MPCGTRAGSARFWGDAFGCAGASRSATISRMDWVCEHCGDQGTAAEGSVASIDELQCPSCGEPVTAR
jgi:rubrerythrin